MADLKEVFTRKRIVTIVAVAIVAVSVFAVFFTMNGNSANFLNRDIRVIITDSMDGEPHPEYEISTIPKDTLVMVRLISDEEKEDIQVGDVVQFRWGKILNHHRVIENNVEGRYLVTQGDNASSSETVSYDKVRGEVVGTNHALGVVVVLVKAYVLFLLILIVVLYIAFKLLEEIRKEKREGGQ